METPPPVPDNTPPQPSPVPPSGGLTEKQWTVLLHLSGLVGLLIPVLGGVIAPLIIWLLKKDQIPSLDPVGRQVLNFQISYAIYGAAAWIVAMSASCLVVPIAFPFIVGIAWLIFNILGGIKASNGEAYTYPLTIKFL